jgi:hypothetical protein
VRCFGYEAWNRGTRVLTSQLGDVFVQEFGWSNSLNLLGVERCDEVYDEGRSLDCRFDLYRQQVYAMVKFIVCIC